MTEMTPGRIGWLPSYAVGELAAIKRKLLAEGADVIDLAAGDCDFPPPEVAVRALTEALGDPSMSRYGFQVGLLEFREAVARYMERRFGVTVDPVKEVLPLLGSKEGLAHLPFAVCDPGDVVVLPDPGYPPYIGGAVLAGAEVYRFRLTVDRGFLLELSDVPREVLGRAKLAYLNYPNNPTTATAPREYLERTLEVCRGRGIVLAYDNPYCEVTFDGYRAPSVLEVEGARDVALEFHSFSKSFSMTGWRLAWAVGSERLIQALARVKGFVDTGPFLAIQKAGAAVLDAAEPLVQRMRADLEQRRDALAHALRAAGIALDDPRATMYAWARGPEGSTSSEFTRRLLEETAVMAVPGSAFGEAGEGYVRFALTVGVDRLREAGERVGSCLGARR